MRILPRIGHSFCATLILSLEFSAILRIPDGYEENIRESTCSMKKFSQVIKSVKVNSLQRGLALPIIPTISETM